MRVTLSFDTQPIFRPEARPIFEAYFRGELTASEATRRLGWRREAWERTLAGIFPIAL